MIICGKCIQAIRSRGEKVVIDDEFSESEVIEDELICEWCEEEAATDLYSVHFPVR